MESAELVYDSSSDSASQHLHSPNSKKRKNSRGEMKKKSDSVEKTESVEKFSEDHSGLTMAVP
jgi:hypothetical protein